MNVEWGTLVLLLLYLAISLKSEYLLMAFLPRTEQRPAFSRLIDKARLTSEVLYPKSLTAKWQIMPLASLTCLFRLAEISDASFRSRWNATAFINCSNGIFFFLTFSQASPACLRASFTKSRCQESVCLGVGPQKMTEIIA